MGNYIVWTMKDIADMVKEMQIEKFDGIIAFCGKRGLSKSTGAYRLGKKLKFRPKRDIVFTRDELIKALHSYDRFIDGDEAINVGYKRDFQEVDQKDLIKILNMYRDHRNVLILCVPNFWDLDRDLRNMVKIRIDLIRRGFGIVHTQVKTMYTNDPWDMKYNQKIEQGWAKKKRLFPRYSHLSTFKGIIKFGALSEKDEIKYQKIKDEKRNNIRKKDSVIQADEEQGFYQRIVTSLKEGKIHSKNELEAIALVNNLSFKAMCNAINEKLRDERLGKTIKHLIPNYNIVLTQKSEESKSIVRLPFQNNLGILPG